MIRTFEDLLVELYLETTKEPVLYKQADGIFFVSLINKEAEKIPISAKFARKLIHKYRLLCVKL